MFADEVIKILEYFGGSPLVKVLIFMGVSTFFLAFAVFLVILYNMFKRRRK